MGGTDRDDLGPAPTVILVTPPMAVSPELSGPCCPALESNSHSGIASARSAYRALYRASAATFSGAFPASLCLNSH